MSRIKLLCFGFVYCVLFCNSLPAYADILITPTQVVFEGKERFAHVTLANTSNKSKSYEIDLQYLKMKEGTGSYHFSETAFAAFPLADSIVFAPRRVTLAPGANQRVRLSLRRSGDIPDGDYHAHMRFRAVPELLPEEELEGRLAAQVSINLSYTIPVILRVGSYRDVANIGQISFGQDEITNQPIIKVPVERGDSRYAVLGHLFLYFVDQKGNQTLVGEISNANIFPEIVNRTFNVPVRSEIGSGSLRVLLRHHDLGSGVVYAEKVFPLQ